MPDASLPPVADIPAAPSYGDVQTLLRQFGTNELLQLAPGDSEQGLDEALLLDALRRASREADSYLATRYPVPLTPAENSGEIVWPEPLASFVGDMARYHLTGGDAQESEAIARRYQEALDWLKAVAKGLADLPPPPDGGGGGEDDGEGPGDVSFVQSRRPVLWR